MIDEPKPKTRRVGEADFFSAHHLIAHHYKELSFAERMSFYTILEDWRFGTRWASNRAFERLDAALLKCICGVKP